MSFIQSVFGGVHFWYGAYKNIKTAKEIFSATESLFSPETINCQKEIFHKVIPTKKWWRGSDSADMRGMVRKTLEEARGHFDIAIKKEFDNHCSSNTNVKTKQDLMAQSAQSYCVYELIQSFLLDVDLIKVFCAEFLSPEEKNAFENDIKLLLQNLQNLQEMKSQSHKYINKENELRSTFENLNKGNQISSSLESMIKFKEDLVMIQDQYIQTSLLSKENAEKIEQYSNEIQNKFTSILNKVKETHVKQNKKINNLKNKKMKHFFKIITRIPSTFQIKSEEIEFICLRDAIKNDPEFRFKIVSLFYRFLFDPLSCTEFILSLGAPGKALLACLSTRKRFWFFHSRDHLPASATAFFRMLGLKKEDLCLVKEKQFITDPNDPHGHKKPSIVLTEQGSLLYQEIENLNRNKNEKDTLLISLFGHSRKEESADKHGLINSVWDEIDAKWDNYTISSYLDEKKVLNKKIGNSKESRKNFLKAINKLEFYSSKRAGDSISNIFNKRFEKLNYFIKNMQNAITDKNSPVAHQLIDLDRELKLEVIDKYAFNKICFLEYNNIEVKFLEMAVDILNNEEQNKTNLEKEFKNELKYFIYHAWLSFYYRTYDLKINQQVKMASSLMQPKGAIRTIIENSQILVAQTSEKISNEIRSLKENSNLKQLKEICSDQQSLVALICCHKNFMALENRSIQGTKDEIFNQVNTSFETNISSVFLSNSLGVTDYLKMLNKKFFSLISELVFHKKYSEFAKILLVKIIVKDKPPLFLTFEELSNYAPTKSSAEMLTTKFLSEILKDNCLSFEIELDENHAHNKSIKGLEIILGELNRLFSGQDIMAKLTDKLLRYQQQAILNVIKQFIQEFGLSEGAAKEIEKICNESTSAHSETNLVKKLELLNAVDKKFSENQILSDIINFINELNTDSLQTGQKFKEPDGLSINKNDEGVGGIVSFTHVFSGKTNTLKILAEKSQGGVFFKIFSFIMEKLLGNEVNQSVKDQLTDKESLTTKFGRIADSFFNFTIDYASFIESNLICFAQNAHQITDVLASCNSLVSSNSLPSSAIEQPIKVKKIETKLQQLGRFSKQISYITTHVEDQKKKIEDKLYDISKSLSLDQVTKQKSDALSLYCSQKCADIFERTFFSSSQLQSDEPLKGTVSVVKVLKQVFSREKGVTSEIIPIHDANPYRNILQSDYKNFLSMFIQSRLGIYQGKGQSNNFSKMISLWTDLESLLNQEPYYFDGFYFKGTGYEIRCLNTLELMSNDGNKSSTLYINDNEFLDICNEINSIKIFLQEEIPIYNGQSKDDSSEEKAFKLLEIINIKFSTLEKYLTEKLEGKRITKEQYNTLEIGLKFIGDIRKFNTYFFRIGHLLIQKATTESDSNKKTTQYQEYLSTIGSKLINLRRELFEIEQGHAATQPNLTSFLAFREDFFRSNIRVNGEHIKKWKSEFSSYKQKWEEITRHYFGLKDEKIKEYIASKFKQESSSFQQVEIDLLTAETLFSLYDADKTHGLLLFSELVLFRFLKEHGLLKPLITLQDFIQKNVDYNREDGLDISDLREFRALAFCLQSGLNEVAQKKEFNKIESEGIFTRFQNQLGQWFWSSNKSTDLQIQRNTKSTEKLKYAVMKLMDDFVKFAFKHSVLNFNYTAERVSAINEKTKKTNNYLQSIFEYEVNLEFYHILTNLHLTSLPENITQKCDNILKRIDSFLSNNETDRNKDLEDRFMNDVYAFNQYILNLRNILQSNIFVKNNFFAERVDNFGKKYLTFVSDIENKGRGFKYEDLIKVFPYAEVIDKLKVINGNYFDILIGLTLENSSISYTEEDDEIVNYTIKSGIEIQERENIIKVNFSDNKIELIYLDQVIPSNISAFVFVKCSDLRNKAKKILDKKINKTFPKIIGLDIPFIYNINDIQNYLRSFPVFKDENSNGGIIFNFSNSKYYYCTDLSDKSNRNEFRVSHSSSDNGIESTHVSVYSPATGEQEYIGWWQKDLFSIEAAFYKSKDIISSKSHIVNMDFPDNIKFYLSSGNILLNIYDIFDTLKLNLKIINTANKKLRSISQLILLLNQNSNKLQKQIHSTVQFKKELQKNDKIIFDLISQLLEVFQIISETDIYCSIFSEFGEVCFKYNSKNYEKSKSGILKMLLDNQNSKDGNNKISLFLKENPLKDDHIMIDVIDEELYIKYDLFDDKQVKRMDSLILPPVSSGSSLVSIKTTIFNRYTEI